MHWIDIVLIAIIAISAIIGLFKGFFDGLISICSIFVSFIIAVCTANWFAGIIRSIVDIDGWLNIVLRDTFGVADSLVVFGTSYPREKVAAFLTVVFSAVVIFILIRCIVALLKNLFKALTAGSRAIGGLNKILGLLLGAIKGALGASVILIVCSVITSLGVPGLTDVITNNINNTTVTKYAFELVDQIVEDKMTGKTFEEIIDGVFDKNTANEQQANTDIIIVYENGKNYYEFSVGQNITDEDITILYKTGNVKSIVSFSDITFVDPIDTTTIKGETTITIIVYGIEKTLTYKVI
ncbi:MAG: CvpA family protein [Clostridiales bacterium]|nr:CvpA family protein [Clostridiales bacterium]